GQRRQALDRLIAARDRLSADDGPTLVVGCRNRDQGTVLFGTQREELRRPTVLEVVENVFARGDVDGEVAPRASRDLGEAPLEQRLRRRDDLDDGRVAGREIACDGPDQ